MLTNAKASAPTDPLQTCPSCHATLETVDFPYTERRAPSGLCADCARVSGFEPCIECGEWAADWHDLLDGFPTCTTHTRAQAEDCTCVRCLPNGWINLTP